MPPLLRAWLRSLRQIFEALLYQELRDVMGAVRHWRSYLKLDSASPWAQIARRELKKLEAGTVLSGSRPSVSKLELLKSEKA